MLRSILLVEDSVTQAMHVQDLLSTNGYAAEVARDGKAGLERARELLPDLIISDVVMPEMDGYEFCRAIKLDPVTRRIPFILLTDRRTPADILRGLEMGADNFITKPIDDEYLLTRVNRISENLAYRAEGMFEVEILLTVGPRKITINADKQQIVELLFSTSEELSVVNEKLAESQRALQEYALTLERAVEERTKELQASLETLKQTMEDRQALADRLIRAQELERQRIAMDVHDDSLQVMAATAIRLGTFSQKIEDPEQQARIQKVAASVEASITRLRHLVFRLVPPALDTEGLAAVLRTYLEELKDEWSLRFSLQDNLDREPPPGVGVLVYRIIQEALTNTCKHASAVSVEVSLKSVDEGVRVTVRDDGRGFVTDGRDVWGFGTRTMRERAEMAGGWFTLQSAPGQGTSVSFWIPESADHTEPSPATASERSS